MQIGTSIRKGVGLAVSAAALLALLPLGASGAMADDVANDGYVDMGTDAKASITLNAKGDSYLNGHSFKLLRIGTYEKAEKNKDNKITGIQVGTPDNVKNETKTAYINATGDTSLPAGYEDNPVGAVATKMLGFHTEDGEGLTPNQDETASTGTYEGKLRNFAQELAGDTKGTLNGKFEGATGTMATDSSTGAASVKFDGLAQGLYIVKDVTNPASLKGSQIAIPMVVGTAVGAANLDSFADASGMKLGVVNMKDDVVSINKTMAEKSLSTGQWGHFTVTTKVPLTTGFTKDNYKFTVTDSPSYGFTLPASSDAAHYYKVRVDGKEIASDLLGGILTANQSSSLDKTSSIVFDFGNAFLDHKDVFPYGANIEITYALQNSGKQRGIQNSVSLDYSTQPGCTKENNNGQECPSSTVTPPNGPVKPKTYSFKLGNVLRTNGTKLVGSTFTITLVKDASGADVTSSTPIKFVSLGDNVYKQADDASTGSAPTLTINDSAAKKGILELQDIDAGTYEIQQTGAPQNPHLRAVMLPKFDVTLTPNADDSAKADIAVQQDAWHLAAKASDVEAVNYNVVVNNVPSVMQLPLTGGAGIILAIIVALVLAALLGITVVMKRRHEAAASRTRV
ncbi:LPXTG-motif cell wall anchor domain-containing protein [Bifidobacterium bohemicum]|uniref:Putative fimbrial subunit FimA n=1 Tax=Bifidobacterium bohemicum DSM 22767 TaxID=1437606 RepID=A0A086ZEQ4_9BIFI|nr:LPXTG cell wall anchor domain-containing protein [Bifidobacterium bohemicum]KFI45004.1 putative fimbrial subunit FimA [Bifidobacterium bohemicum DSM 22767]SCC13084.1 LPXTG-motif cell wall anchor domain-containing protein [Bifidobacterium bohemicum]